MPTTQATRAAGALPRVGVSFLPQLALNPPHTGTNNAIGRQSVGVSSRPEIFVDEELGQLEADRRDGSQRAETLGERHVAGTSR